MQLLELTLDDPCQNIALDEALLEAAEQERLGTEVLRLWHPMAPLVVLGRSSSIGSEVNVDYCDQHQIPVIRRCSGGASIVCAPGCLMYAVLLSYEKHPELRMLEQAHRFVMSRIQGALDSLAIESDYQGTCDLTVDNRKFSGNALRCKKNWLIYHGTLLFGMDLNLIFNCLDTPDRQPAYRNGRSHEDFVGQIPVSMTDLSQALINAWQARSPLLDWPQELTHSLVSEKYSKRQWNHKVK